MHGLAEASTTGEERPPGFEAFVLLPGRCSPGNNDAELLALLRLCLKAQWLAWRAAHASHGKGSPHKARATVSGPAPAAEAVTAATPPALRGVLESVQLFELTRQVAEQAVTMHANLLQVS